MLEVNARFVETFLSTLFVLLLDETLGELLFKPGINKLSKLLNTN